MGLQSVKQGILDLAQSPPPSLVRGARLAAILAIPAMVVLVLSPLLVHPWTFGQHDWDQMNTQREVVVKTILRFGQFPLWDPYECGGHAAWSSLESDPIAVSPWLPAYLLAPLPIAIRVEIVLSALWGALGCWLLAGRFTRSVALRALLAIAVAVNSRWALQLAAGHTWHLLYGFLPWTLYLFDRAIEPGAPVRRARRDVVLAAACIAAMVYGDGIYPVPHTAFLLVVYAAFVARSMRSWRPLRAVAAVGAIAVGLASPKLLPLFEELQRYPRHIASEEAIFPQDIVRILTDRVGDFLGRASFINGMWHEWGLYLGWLGLGLLVAGVAASRGPRERGLKWAAFVMVLFVIGGFHQLTPWRVFHLLPLFKSQHVPSRWLYPAVLALGCAAVSGGERWLARSGRRRASLEVLLGFAAAALALDMGLVARLPIAQSFVNPVPALDDRTPPFHMVHRLPPRDGYEPCLPEDVATLPGVLDNVGTLECDTYAGVHMSHRDEEGRMPGVGAWGEDDPEYRGETYVAEGGGAASVVSWTPNDVEVRVEGARPGDHVVVNQNWDPGWSADGAPAIAYQDAVASVLTAPAQTIHFRYWPRALGWGLALLGVTAASVALWMLRREEAQA
ncbi:MAG TPA: hypothetical protein VGL81_18075 [Polyangiaceae bacterium]